MTQFLIRRIFTIFVLMWLMTVIVFALSSASGGGLDRLFPTNAASPFDIVRQKSSQGIDRTPAQQYFTWLGRIFRGNLGISQNRRGETNYMPLGTILLPMFKASIALIGLSLALCVFTGLILGTFAALRPNHILTRLISLLCVINVSIPDFAVGILLMLVFAVRLRWLPSSGFSDPIIIDPTWWQTFVDRIRHLILPSITLSFTYTAAFTEHVRKTMSDVMHQDYIRTARSKGLPEWAVIFKHGMRNSLVPTVAAVFSSLPFLFGGIVVTEYLFALPGVGMYVFRNMAGYGGDFYIVLLVTGIASFFSLLASLVADFLYALADPRITNPARNHVSAKPYPAFALLGICLVVAAVYHGNLFILYERLGDLRWAQIGLGAGLLAVAIPVQIRFARNRFTVNRAENARRGFSGSLTRFRIDPARLLDFLRRLTRPSILFGLIVLWLLVLSSYYPVYRGFLVVEDLGMNINQMTVPPSLAHPFGTDTYGRDLVMVILLLGRQTIQLAFSVALIGTIAGTALGVLCGFLQGMLDRVVMAVIDLFSAVPSYFLVFLVVGLIGRSTSNITLVLSLFGLIEIARVVRAQVLTIREFPFVEAAQALGNSGIQVIVRHLLRNLLSLMWGQGIILVGRTMLMLCSLGYLGILEFPTWGSLVSQSVRSSLYLTAWWTCIFPVIMIFIAVVAINALGKGVLKAFDPFAQK